MLKRSVHKTLSENGRLLRTKRNKIRKQMNMYLRFYEVLIGECTKPEYPHCNIDRDTSALSLTFTGLTWIEKHEYRSEDRNSVTCHIENDGNSFGLNIE